VPGREDVYSVVSPRVYQKHVLHCVSSPLASGDVQVLESECKLNVISQLIFMYTR